VIHEHEYIVVLSEVCENFRIAMYAFCRIAALKIQFFTGAEMINKTRCRVVRRPRK